jgi:hypothetical protein
MFGGFALRVVEQGTEIINPDTGERLTVTDTGAVRLRSTLYMTQRTYDALKERVNVAGKAPP